MTRARGCPTRCPTTSRAPGPAADRDSLYAGIAGLAPVLAEIAQSRRARRHRAGTSRTPSSPGSPRRRATRTEASLYDGLAGDATALAMLAPGTEAAPLQRVAALMTPAGWPTTLGEDGSRRAVHRHRAGHRRRGPDRHLGRRRARRRDRRRWWRGAAGRGRPHRRRPRLGQPPGRAVQRPQLLARHRGHRDGARHGRGRAGPRGLRRGRGAGRAAPAGRGLAGRRRLHRPAHHPAHHPPRGGAGDLHLVPRPGRHLAPVRGAGPRRRHRGRRPGGQPTCADGACTRSSPRASRSGCAPGSGTTTAAAAAPPGRGRAARRRPGLARPGRGGTCCWPRPAPWATRWSSARSATRTARAGGSSSTARTRRCCRPGTSWMQGAAGIAAFLLRLARVLEDGPDSPVVDRPDQWWAVPARLRTVWPRSAAEQGA